MTATRELALGVRPVTRAAATSRARSRERMLRGASTVLKLLVALVMLFPLIWMVLTALEPTSAVAAWPPRIIPSHWEWGNVLQVEKAGPFARWYLNSLIVAVATIAGDLVVGIPAAYAFARMKFPGRNALFLVVLGSLMIPGEVLLVPLFVMLSGWGWVDSYQALIVPFLANAFVIFLLKQFFEGIPAELEEAAVLDGCGPVRIMWNVVVPLSRPALAVAAFMTFISSWNSYLYPLIVTRSPSMRTVTVGLSLFKSENGTDWPLLMSAATLVALPAIIVFLLIERHLKNTMALSGMKG
ncbi:carbohydrate ABC transporter permease [Gryllotalpicola reticulitermitis]|uniref:Carbohydrate ABC transporter permease n=1 Tax=Gryllotalpicola reticulitermitis TaxID=1184153 RepID=A0ABV8Q5H1_9MICO